MIDWKDASAMRELTKVLLEHDYNIKWDMPLNHLCPPVSNRANYIHWIHDLLSLKQSKKLENTLVKGIDMYIDSF